MQEPRAAMAVFLLQLAIAFGATSPPHESQENTQSMDTFIQQMINGLVLGSVYALIALGYTMVYGCLLYTSPSPRDRQKSRMPSSA